MPDLPIPQFISTDAGQVVAEMKAFYETAVGKPLYPGQPEMQVINTLAYREVLQRIGINEAAKQNLVQFANAPILDYLADLVGVVRIPAQPAICTIEFTLVAGHGNGVVPAGMRISSSDGVIVFTTDTQVSFLSTDTTVDVPCTAQQTGIIGNGYIAGTVTTILDPQAAISTGQNIDTTAGGTDDETDENLRERIRLAPNSYSTAGSVDSYKFAAKSADAGIVDVTITSQAPGTVQIYPLMTGGALPTNSILSKVLLACSDEKVRPLTDTVTALAPSAINYRITANLTLYTGADQVLTTQAVTQKLTAYTEKVQSTLGFDILESKIKGMCTDNDSVYDAQIILELEITIFNIVLWINVPQIVLTPSQFGKLNSLSVNVVGLNNG